MLLKCVKLPEHQKEEIAVPPCTTLFALSSGVCQEALPSGGKIEEISFHLLSCSINCVDLSPPYAAISLCKSDSGELALFKLFSVEDLNEIFLKPPLPWIWGLLRLSKVVFSDLAPFNSGS